MAKEAAKAAKAATYKHRVVEMEARLTAEVTIICRDYCAETYYQTLDRAGVPTNFDLRRADKVYYPEDIRKDPTTLPPPAALPLPPPEQPLTTQDPSQGIEILAGVQKEKKGMWGSLGQKRRRRRKQRVKLMPIPPRMPLQLKIWCPKLKLLNPSPRLTPRKIFINHRLRYSVLASFFAIFVMASCFLIKIFIFII